MTNKKNLIAVGIVALSLFLFFAVVLPEYDGIQNARAALVLREAKFQERTNLLARVAQLNTDYEAHAQAVNTISGLIPATLKQDEVVSSMSTISSQAGVGLDEISITDPQPSGNDAYRTSILNLRISGRYPQLVAFLKLLEQNLRLYDVSELTISDTGEGGSQNGLLNFQLKIFINVLNTK